LQFKNCVTDLQGGPVLNVNNSPIDSPSKDKFTCIMSFSSRMLPKEDTDFQSSI